MNELVGIYRHNTILPIAVQHIYIGIAPYVSPYNNKSIAKKTNEHRNCQVFIAISLTLSPNPY
jgi:hypothetical protein